MMRTEGMALNRSHTAGASSIDEMSLRGFARRTRRRFARRELLALPVALALLVPVAPVVAQASTGTSGYNQKPPTPTTTTPKPKKAVEPSKEATKTTPTATVEPTTTPAAKASTLPFTGLDLRWVVGAGLLLLSAGLAIRLGQRPRAGR
jgi:cell division septation protein DedD